jgi:hypothetical protein
MVTTKPEVILPETQHHALRVKCNFSKDWEQWVWFQSDLHFDSPEWQKKLYHKHAKTAMERDALFVDLGDLFDAINSTGDKRGGKGGFANEDNEPAYLDKLVDRAVEEFRPYAENWIYAGTGNHESKVLKIHETDLSNRFIREMNLLRGKDLPPIYRAGYDGWITFQFAHSGGGREQAIACKLHHGHGGGGEVTKGVIQDHRAAAATEGYGLYVSGHVHEQYMLKHLVEGLNSTGRVRTFERQHVRVASYKADFRTDGVGTWHMQRGGRAKPLGGAFVRFYCPEKMIVAFEVSYPHVNYDSLE